MPGTDLPLEQLKAYTSPTPCPPDFADVWQAARHAVESFTPHITLTPMDLGNDEAAYHWVQITAPDGCILRAKWVYPTGEAAVPAVLQWHDYPLAARSWLHLTRYAALGWAVLAPDCRGQGGTSEGGPLGAGPTAWGPMFNGMEGPVQEMYLFRLFADALLWCKVLRQLPGVDAQHLAVYGEGAGGALAIVCAAMAPGFVKCAAHYPLLCHYARVWELDFDTGPYEGLRYYFRWHDPLHQRRQEIFERLAYVDAVNFAPYVHCPVLLSTGLQDTVSPPSAQFALANALQAPLQHKVYPKHGHELNNFFENEWLRFLLTEAMQPVC